MGLQPKTTARHKILPACCLLSALFSFFQIAIGQDLNSPRFFTFNIQSLGACTVPAAQQQSIARVAPLEMESTFMYEFSLRFPVKMKGDTKIFGELSHQNEHSSGLYDFEEGTIDNLKPLTLYQTSGSMILLHQFSEKWKLINILNVRTNSNLGLDFNRQALRLSNAAILQKKVPKGDLGFGIAFSANQSLSILPIIKYEAALNDKWGLDILFPSRILATRNFSKSTRLLFGARGDAATYLLTNDDGLHDPFVGSNFRRININGVVGFEKQITKMVGFSAEAGISVPYKNGIFDYQNTSLGLHDFQNQISPHFRVGFFLALPR